MTEQELNQIFGTLDSLIPLHEGKTQIVFVCIIIAHRFKFGFIKVRFLLLSIRF